MEGRSPWGRIKHDPMKRLHHKHSKIKFGTKLRPAMTKSYAYSIMKDSCLIPNRKIRADNQANTPLVVARFKTVCEE